MKNGLISHAAFGCATALFASCVTYVMLARWSEWIGVPVKLALSEAGVC
jgi:hypothetical protein